MRPARAAQGFRSRGRLFLGKAPVQHAAMKIPTDTLELSRHAAIWIFLSRSRLFVGKCRTRYTTAALIRRHDPSFGSAVCSREDRHFVIARSGVHHRRLLIRRHNQTLWFGRVPPADLSFCDCTSCAVHPPHSRHNPTLWFGRVFLLRGTSQCHFPRRPLENGNMALALLWVIQSLSKSAS